MENVCIEIFYSRNYGKGRVPVVHHEHGKLEKDFKNGLHPSAGCKERSRSLTCRDYLHSKVAPVIRPREVQLKARSKFDEETWMSGAFPILVTFSGTSWLDLDAQQVLRVWNATTVKQVCRACCCWIEKTDEAVHIFLRGNRVSLHQTLGGFKLKQTDVLMIVDARLALDRPS